MYKEGHTKRSIQGRPSEGLDKGGIRWWATSWTHELGSTSPMQRLWSLVDTEQLHKRTLKINCWGIFVAVFVAFFVFVFVVFVFLIFVLLLIIIYIYIYIYITYIIYLYIKLLHIWCMHYTYIIHIPKYTIKKPQTMRAIATQENASHLSISISIYIYLYLNRTHHIYLYLHTHLSYTYNANE
jgi:hypothetical protein